MYFSYVNDSKKSLPIFDILRYINVKLIEGFGAFSLLYPQNENAPILSSSTFSRLILSKSSIEQS